MEFTLPPSDGEEAQCKAFLGPTDGGDARLGRMIFPIAEPVPSLAQVLAAGKSLPVTVALKPETPSGHRRSALVFAEVRGSTLLIVAGPERARAALADAWKSMNGSVKIEPSDR